MRQQVPLGRVVGERRAAMALALVLTCVPSLVAEVHIFHDGVDCVVAGAFPVIEAKLEPSGEVARARVYFKARGTPYWYYVDMKSQGGDAFEGVLPKPLATLDGLD